MFQNKQNTNFTNIMHTFRLQDLNFNQLVTLLTNKLSNVIQTFVHYTRKNDKRHK